MKTTIRTWPSGMLLCFLLFFHGGAHAAGEALTVAQASALIQTILNDAEGRILSLHGPSAMERLKQKIAQEYNLDQLPTPAANPPCPAVGFTTEDMGVVIHARPIDKAGAYFVAGNGAFLGMHPELARWCFAKAASLVPMCPIYLSNLAFLLNEEGEYMDAVRLLEYASGLDPDEDSIYVNLAYGYQHLKRYEEAIRALLVAVALNPNLPNYRQMLLDLQQMLDREKTVTATGGAGSSETGPQPPQLDAAMDLLEERKSRKNLEELASRYDLPPPRGGGASSRVRPGSRVSSRSFTRESPRGQPAYSSSNCMAMCPNVGLLERLGDEALLGSGFQPRGGDPIGKFRTAGDLIIKHTSKDSTFTQVKEFARGGGLVMGLLFYGYAGEISLQCCQTDNASLGYEDAERLLKEVKRESAERVRKYFEELSKPEEFGLPVCTEALFVNYCVSQGEKGSKRFEISSDSGSFEFTMHPTDIYRYAVKVSHGPAVKADIVKGVSGEVSVKTYTECRFGGGCSRGVDAGASISGGKFITTSYGTSTTLIKTTLENYPGAPDKKP